jgi:threonine dehydratase
VQLSDEQKARGVITASAGNHAQGVALAARSWDRGDHRHALDHAGTQGARRAQSWRQALLHGESFPFALAHALQLAEQPGAPLFRRSTTRR